LNEAIARLLGTEAKSVSLEEANKQFGAMAGLFSINSRLSAEKARRELGWEPKAKTTITDDIENGSYRNFREQKTAAFTK
jgi:nucleoside-diphosphate-sugar epimerase